MTDDLKRMLELASSVVMEPAQKERQRRSFAFGNTHFENPQISREMVDREAEKLDREHSQVDDRR